VRQAHQFNPNVFSSESFQTFETVLVSFCYIRTMRNNNSHLRDTPLLKEATEVTEYMYDVVLNQFGDFSEEKFNTESKIRRAANDVMFYVAQAVGSTTKDATEYDWSNARKNLLSLQSMYIFASKRFIEIEPSVVTRIDKLIKQVDQEIKKTKQEISDKTKKDLEPWLEKYKLWKEMSEEKPKSSKKKRRT